MNNYHHGKNKNGPFARELRVSDCRETSDVDLDPQVLDLPNPDPSIIQQK